MKNFTRILSLATITFCLLLSSQGFGQDEDPTNELNTGVSLNGTTLKVTDAGGDQSVDLAPLQDGTGTDDQTLQLNGTTLSIEDGNAVDLSSIDTDTDTDDQNLQLNGTQLSIDDGNTVDLSSFSSQWTSSGNDIYNNNSGNVGVGLNNPTSTLHVKDEIGIGETYPAKIWKPTYGGLKIGGPDIEYTQLYLATERAIIAAGNINSSGDKGIQLYTGYAYTPNDWNGYNLTMHLKDEKVGIGTGPHSIHHPLKHKLTVRGGSAYFNSLSYGETTSDKWSTAVVIGVNQADDDDAATPNREMRFVQGGEIPSGSGNYGVGIAFGMAPDGGDKWVSGHASSQQILIRYLGGKMWIQTRSGSGNTQFTDNNLQNGNNNGSGKLNNVIRISDPYSGLHPFGVYGNMWTSGVLYQSSDARFKKNITSVKNASEKVMRLRGTTYQYDRDKFKGMSEGDQYGFIAQEVQKVLPELVSEEEGGYMSVNYSGVIPVLVEAFKEQTTVIEAQSEKIAILERELNMLKGSKSVINTSSSAKLSSSTELSAVADVVTLEQNRPNPFSENTSIDYFLPESVSQAAILVYDMNGRQLKEMTLTEKGKGSVNINGRELSPGMYMYALIADGQEIDVKRMILTD